VTSITAALSLLAWAFNLVCSDTSDQSLSRLTEGENSWFLWRRKVLIPHLPKYPGWLYGKAKVKLCSHDESHDSCDRKYSLSRHISYLQFVHVDSHVVHATSETTTTGVLSVLSNSTMTVWNVSSQLPGLSQSCNLRHIK